MIRRQVINTSYLDDRDIRALTSECPNCGYENGPVEVGQANACGAIQCANCGIWYEYQEDYEEVPDHL